MDKLIRALHRASFAHGGQGIKIMCDGRLHSFKSGVSAAAFLTIHKGRKLRYRFSSFADGSHGKLAMVIR